MWRKFLKSSSTQSKNQLHKVKTILCAQYLQIKRQVIKHKLFTKFIPCKNHSSNSRNSIILQHIKHKGTLNIYTKIGTHILFFWLKSGILYAQLHKLIPRTLWDSNGRQTLSRSFKAPKCPSQESNPGHWRSHKRLESSHLSALRY
jgi:hypothetical protein